jgi:hypothetical protein
MGCEDCALFCAAIARECSSQASATFSRSEIVIAWERPRMSCSSVVKNCRICCKKQVWTICRMSSASDWYAELYCVQACFTFWTMLGAESFAACTMLLMALVRSMSRGLKTFSRASKSSTVVFAVWTSVFASTLLAGQMANYSA